MIAAILTVLFIHFGSGGGSFSFEKAFEPFLKEAITETPRYEQVIQLTRDADENMKLCGHYKLRGFPTVLLFVNGEEVERFASARPAPFVREFIDRHLPK